MTQKWQLVIVFRIRGTSSLGRGVNREGFDFKLAIVKMCFPLTPFEHIYHYKIKSIDPTINPDPLYNLWERQKMKTVFCLCHGQNVFAVT